MSTTFIRRELEADAAAGHIALNLLTLAVLSAFVPLRGWILQVLWGWFISPSFGAAAPSLALCCGLMLLAAFVLPKRRVKPKARPWSDIGEALFTDGLFLLFGWLIHLWAG